MKTLPSLVLLPGLDGTGLLLTGFINALSAEVKVSLVDYPSDKSMNYVELEEMVRARLPQSEPFCLLAESFSGPLAVSIAARPPKGLKGVILSCSFASNPRPELKMLRPLLSVISLRVLPMALMSYFVLGRFATRSVRTALSMSVTGVSQKVLSGRLEEVLSVDVRPDLSAIELPLLYLRAKGDRLVPQSALRAIRVRQPRVKAIEFDAPHFLLQTKPLEAAEAVKTFLADLGDG